MSGSNDRVVEAGHVAADASDNAAKMTVTYTIGAADDVNQHRIEYDYNAMEAARIGLPLDQSTPVKPPAGSFAYSGMHDHGPLLPPPKEGGTVAKLINTIQLAKKANDEYLTKIIQEEQASTPVNKRQKSEK